METVLVPVISIRADEGHRRANLEAGAAQFTTSAPKTGCERAAEGPAGSGQPATKSRIWSCNSRATAKLSPWCWRRQNDSQLHQSS